MVSVKMELSALAGVSYRRGGHRDRRGLKAVHLGDTLMPGFQPVAEESVVLAGVREIEPAERTRLYASEVTVIGADSIRREKLRVFADALDELKGKVVKVYVHLDLDVLDPVEVGYSNEFAPDDGLGAKELEAALEMVRERFTIAAAGIASYDPAFDSEGLVLQAAFACAKMLTSSATPAV